MKKVALLRKKYPRFVYERYSWKISANNLEILFDFRIEPDIKFKPKVIIENIDKVQIKRVGARALNNLVFHLGLIELLSYWKATCSPEIKIRADSLNKEQIKWWKALIINGLGQFFYENKINFQEPNFVKIHCLPSFGKKATIVAFLPKLKNRVLVPIGGGKDSIVTLELLKRAKKNIQCFSLNPTEAIEKIMKIAGFQKPIIVRREIDPKLLKLNQKGFLNGHTPFSAYLAFLSIFLAIIFGKRYIALSNERSSNEGNLKYLGVTINHQYSKSFDFEKKFRHYSKKYLARNVEYFSFLRPLYEIQIAKIFSRYHKYFDVFLSCNESFKTASGTKKPTKKWCGKCPKCLFVFVSLSPFVEKEKLIKIFGKNLFEDPEGKHSASYGAGKKLLSIMKQLIGEEKFKPLECVGTKKECLIAFYLGWKKTCGGPTSAKLPFLLNYFEKKILPKYPNHAPYRTCSGAGLETESKKILNSWNEQNYLPKKFKKILRKKFYEIRKS
ncbi:hypothetical protein KJ636_02755 [Patescibacteria group bacterium]|nr:hypothetical protein [Patescibacteria group bacterium]MBU4480990.1 hypothetical protein [Patescibacteria group bacterium]